MLSALRSAVRPFKRRKGVVVVIAALLMAFLFAFVAFSVDTGMIVMTQTRMQNGCDAAALAASQEITGAAVAQAGSGSAVSIDLDAAREMARDVAEKNGVYIDPDQDVEFGKRVFNESTGTWSITWGADPYNVVRVTARRDQSNLDAPDGRLRLLFGWAVAKESVELTVASTAFVQARDLVVVLDYSSSMNNDTRMSAFGNLGQANVEANLDDCWQALVDADPHWPSSTRSKFPSTGFGGVHSAEGTHISDETNLDDILEELGLDEVDGSGDPVHPYPQSGRDSSGNFKPMPSASSSESKWKDYIKYVRDKSGYYKRRYGYRTLIDYMLKKKYKNKYSEDLWRTPHYPFHAMKDGLSLCCEFLDNLEFGDELGLVVYDSNSHVETTLNEDGHSINISSDPITDDYDAIDVIQRHKQAAHYNSGTGMGYGIKEARVLMLGDGASPAYLRYGSRPTMLVITDGRTNKRPSGWTPPADWDWVELTDYDGNGVANYITTDWDEWYSFYEAREAIRRGVTVHTMSVGASADSDLMEAIAFAGGGIWIDVPGGATIDDMRDQMNAAFNQIASKVPPAQLVSEE